jgi:hypothetical protein
MTSAGEIQMSCKSIFFLFVFLLGSPICFGFSFDNNVPETMQEQITQDLEFLKTINGKLQSDLHQQIFGDLSGITYLQFFYSRITSIGKSECGSKEAVACVLPISSPSKMWITDNYIRFSHPQIARIMSLFHEAKHTESIKRFWPHSICPNPFLDESNQPVKSIWTKAHLAGRPACDHTAYGSYGSSLIMLKNISKFCDTCTEKVKIDAGIYADDQLKRITLPSAYQQIIDDLYRAS